MDDSDSKRESRARREARRQGLNVRKSRARNPAINPYYGLYWLVDDSNCVVVGHSFGVTLDELEAALAEE
ncbi:hypothetical protein GCM10027418_24210 [Mariniluteicoccus endophyticus]